MIIHNLDPVFFNIGPLEVRYYGLVYAIGFLIALWIIPKLAKKHGIKTIDQQVTADFIFWSIIGGILGSRLFATMVYNPKYYISNPLEILKIWHGGMSFFGGLLGVIIVTYFFCKKKKIKFYDIVDLAVIPFAFALIFGRIANFINAELVGRPSNLPWCTMFKEGDVCRHPSQIYEAIKNMIIFTVLLILNSKKRKPGLVFWSFMTMYTALRFSVEFFREEVLYAKLSISQWIALPVFIFSVIFLVRIWKK